MTREDLKNYKYNQIWIKDQMNYIEVQKETINTLNSTLSDMPKGSRKVNDTEAENISKLIDSFDEMMKIIVQEEEKQKKIVEQINKIEFPYRNILFKVYIQGKSLVTVASELNYSYVHICREHGIALNKFDDMKCY